jgi:hypothetical protein
VFHLLSRTRCVSIRYGFVDDDNRVSSTIEEKRIPEESLLISAFNSTFHRKDTTYGRIRICITSRACAMSVAWIKFDFK